MRYRINYTANIGGNKFGVGCLAAPNPNESLGMTIVDYPYWHGQQDVRKRAESGFVFFVHVSVPEWESVRNVIPQPNGSAFARRAWACL